MARVILADDGIVFDGRTPEQGPLGGAESSVIQLVETLAARGHDVSVYNKCAAPLDYRGVKWRPLAEGVPDSADLYIANRGDKLLTLCPNAKKTVFWTHNPCRYMLKVRYLWPFWKRRPVIVFIGAYHATTLPDWVPEGGRKTIPYGLPDLFCEATPADQVPGPRAIFTSNPLRGLDWLLDVWCQQIEPAVPGAELHIFSGAQTMALPAPARATRWRRFWTRRRAWRIRGSGCVSRSTKPS